MKKKKYTSQEQQALVGKWEKSGLNKREFCRENNIIPSTFFTWFKKYGNQKGKENFSQISIPAFENDVDQKLPELEIEYPSGVKVRIFKPVAVAWIKSLI
jgi:transposase-like protein